jgi:hypothetical protein
MRRRHLPIVLALLVAAGAACRDSTGPDATFGVTVALDGPPSVTETVSPEGWLGIRCDVALIASGRNTGVATWSDGVIRFYFGRERKVAADSQPLSAAEVQNAWGTTIRSSAVSRSEWFAYAGVPFDVEFEFHFAGGVAPAKTRFTCGPPAVATATDAPTVTKISVTPSTGTVQAGDTLHITYSASAPGTLWSTTVYVDGPFGFHREIAEHGVASVTRTVEVVVPPAAFFDIPIVVSAEATDPALQTGDLALPTTLTVVDRTPPEVHNAYVQNPSTFGPQFFVGDTIRMAVDAWDNNPLAWVVWDVTGAKTVHDSVHAPTGMTNGVMQIPFVTTSEWVGSSDISFYVRDGTGAPSAVRSAGTVRVSPTFAYPVSAVATAPASSPGIFSDVALDAKREKLYLTLGHTNDIQVFDVATATFGAPIALASPGAGLDLSASGDSLIVAEPETKSLAVVKLAEVGAAPSSIPLTVLDTAGQISATNPPQPMGVRVAANGTAIVQLLYRTAGNDGVVSVDFGSGLQRVRSDGQPRVTPLVQMMGATPDRSRIAIFDPLCPRTYASATDAFTSCAVPQTVYNFQSLRFDAAGQRFSLGNGVFDLSFNRLDQSPGILGVGGVSALSPDGATLYLVASNRVVMLRVMDAVILGRFEVPFMPQAMVMAPGGEWLVVLRRDDVVKAARVDTR